MFPENIQTPAWKELKILKGSGARRPKKFQWGEGIEDKNSSRRARTMTFSQGLWRVFLVLSLVMLRFSYHSSAVNDFGFFNKSCFKAN